MLALLHYWRARLKYILKELSAEFLLALQVSWVPNCIFLVGNCYLSEKSLKKLSKHRNVSGQCSKNIILQNVFYDTGVPSTKLPLI